MSLIYNFEMNKGDNAKTKASLTGTQELELKNSIANSNQDTTTTNVLMTKSSSKKSFQTVKRKRSYSVLATATTTLQQYHLYLIFIHQ